jgi:hypothetical protein
MCENLTPSQTRAIAFLRKKFAPREGDEFKRNEVEIDTYEFMETIRQIVYLRLETGLTGDEGTLAARHLPHLVKRIALIEHNRANAAR